MKCKRFTKLQIIAIMREAEAGLNAADLVRAGTGSVSRSTTEVILEAYPKVEIKKRPYRKDTMRTLTNLRAFL